MLLKNQPDKAWGASSEQCAIFQDARAGRPLRAEPVILLVEDQRFFQHIFRSVLGATRPVLTSTSAEEGWQRYLEHAPDMVFLDVQLAGASGHELAKALHRFDADAFIVMLTAANDIESMAEADENGVRDYITKPYSQKKLLDSIARFTRERAKALQ